MTKTVTVSEAKARLSDYLEMARDEGPVIITRKGKAVAMLVAISGEDDITRVGRSHAAHQPTVANGAQVYGDEALSRLALRESVEQVAPERAAPGQELGEQVDAPPAYLGEMNLAERERWVLEEMVRQGLLAEIKAIDRSTMTKWEPIAIKGKPLSQTIIEDRR
jgi:prevent-host-death family protein